MLSKIFIFLVIFTFISQPSFGADLQGKKEEIASYIKALVAIITEADFIIKDVEFNRLPMKEGAKRLKACIGKTKPLKYPSNLSTLNNKVILSFKKIRLGFILFDPKRKDVSIKLIKEGAMVLKSSALEIKDIVEKQGLKKKQGDAK